MTASAQPIHVAITRRIKPGREQEFQTALKEFFARSLAESGVHGAAMLVPPPGSGSAEYGIIRSFASTAERDAFYASPLYLDWKKRVAPLSDGEPEARELHGLEAFFRSNSAGSSTSLENGHCHLPRCRSGHHDAGSHPRTTHPLLEFRTLQSRLQCLCGGAFDLGGHAA